MRPVKDFCGNWNPERRAIQFKWDVSGMENDRFIHIVGLQETNGRLKPEMAKYQLFDICDMKNVSQSSTFMPIASLGIGVYKMRFCAFSMPQATACSDEDILHACEKNPAFMTEVMLGRANVVYVAETTVAENSKIVRIHLKSDCRIAQGVLGYLYRVDNCDIVNAFPASIDKGKKTFPPILIPRECEIKVSHMESQFAGNVQITVKKSKFLF